VYARHYFGACPVWIESAARERRGDLYLLCAPDLPWAADGVRDRPAQRVELFALFEGALAEFACVTADVAGVGAVRERAALSATTALIAAAGHR
jgi:nicotinamide riboside kinase